MTESTASSQLQDIRDRVTAVTEVISNHPVFIKGSEYVETVGYLLATLDELNRAYFELEDVGLELEYQARRAMGLLGAP